MKTYKYLSIVLASVALSSCDLDKAPYGTSNFWTTSGDVQMALDGAYEPLYGEEGFGRGQFWAGIASDDMIVNRKKTDDENITEFRTSTNASSGQYDNWDLMFTSIRRANDVLAHLDLVTDEVKRDCIEGEASFLAAFAYFHLAKRYGGLPLYDYKNSFIENLNLQRATKQKTYEHMESLLLNSIEKFKKHNLWKRSQADSESGRPTLGAAYGLLAKVYAHWGKFKEAKEAAEKVINSGQYSLDTTNNNGFKHLFSIEGEKHEEVLFNLTNRPERNNGTVTSIILLSGTLSQGIGWYYFAPTKSLVNAYEDGDLRRQVTIKGIGDEVNYPALIGANIPEGDGGGKVESLPLTLTKSWMADMSTGYMCTKYAEPYEHLKSWDWEAGKDIPLLRYSDILLIHAEAEIMLAGGGPNNRDKGVAAASKSFNEVRLRAFGGDGSKAIAEPTFNDLIKERRCELAYEDERHYDLVRWGLAKEVYAKGEEVEDPRGNRTFDPIKHSHFPIPQREIENTDNRLYNNPKDGYSNFN